MALMASRRLPEDCGSGGGWARRIAGGMASPGPLLGPGRKARLAQQASSQIVGTVNATNLSSLPAKAAIRRCKAKYKGL
jgi:hypothetical protein